MQIEAIHMETTFFTALPTVMIKVMPSGKPNHLYHYKFAFSKDELNDPMARHFFVGSLDFIKKIIMQDEALYKHLIKIGYGRELRKAIKEKYSLRFKD